MTSYLRIDMRGGKSEIYNLDTGELVVPQQCEPPKRSLSYDWNVKFEQQ